MAKFLRNLFSLTSDIVETIVIALAIFLLVYTLLAQPHRVSGDSMLPNFINGELILTDKISYRFREPQRGDVIVFKAPPDKKKDFIKRIIGLPGETISIADGKVMVNNQVLVENYLGSDTKVIAGSFLPESDKKQIPPGYYFVMGDYRSHSFDSREWGVLAKSDIIGRAWIIYWPLNKLSVIKLANY